MSLLMTKHKLVSTKNLGSFMLVTLRARKRREDPFLKPSNYSNKFMF